MTDTFELPMWWDLLATFLYAIVGTRFAITRGYDIIGVLVLSLVGGVGGGLLRDVVLQAGTPMALRSTWYLTAAWSAAGVGLMLHRMVPRLQRILDIVGAASLGLYGVFGAQKALLLGLSPLSAVFIGFLNAVGGGLLRDIIVRNEPEVFRPGTYFAVATIAGIIVFVTFENFKMVPADVSGIIGTTVTVVIRMLALRFGWQTRAIGIGRR